MIIYCHSTLDKPLRKKLQDALASNHSMYFSIDFSDLEEAKSTFRKAEYVLGNPPAEWFAGDITPLKYWQLDSAGFDQYAGVQLASTVKVANMGNWFAQPCAETIIGGVLALYRGLDTLTILKQKTEWIGTKLRPSLRILFGQNVVILGAGTIAQACNDILKGFKCQTHLYARTSPDATIRTKEDLYEELAKTDLVINTLPGTATNFVNAEFIAALKPGSVYSSVGRGSTTDESALINALKTSRLSGTVLDVTAIEPLPEDSPLWQMEHVILTQHTGGGRKEEHLGKVDLFLNNVFALENGSDIVDQINLGKGY